MVTGGRTKAHMEPRSAAHPPPVSQSTGSGPLWSWVPATEPLAAFIVLSPGIWCSQTGPPAHPPTRPQLGAAASPPGRVIGTSHNVARGPQSSACCCRGPSGFQPVSWAVLSRGRAGAAPGRPGRPHTSSLAAGESAGHSKHWEGPCLLSFPQGRWKCCLPDLYIWKREVGGEKCWVGSPPRPRPAPAPTPLCLYL